MEKMMQRQHVPIRPATESREFRCGSCSALMATFEKGGMTMAVPGTYLGDDGDAIPNTPSTVAGMSSVAMASVGVCAHCGVRHWTLQVSVHDGGMEALQDALADAPESTRYLFAGPTERAWLIEDAEYLQGRVHTHCIGPMPVADGHVTEGRYGVSACGGGDFWVHAARLTADLLPEIEAAQRQLHAG